MNLLAVILCGGESRRMGRDKGSIREGDRPWARIMGDKLIDLKIPLVYSVNKRQEALYGSFLEPSLLIKDNPDIEMNAQGPLRGLLSVHRHFPDKDLLLLACDMLALDRPTLEKMLHAYRENLREGERCLGKGPGHEEYSLEDPRPEARGYDFIVYQDREYAQPFCGIYTSRGLLKEYGRIRELRGEGRADHSLQSLLKRGFTRRVAIDQPEAFTNFNTPGR